MFDIGLIDHLEGPRNRPSAEIYAEVADLVCLADDLGVRYAWFAEHHGHAHEGHLPTPLLLAFHLATQTRQIHLGAAVICLNLHHPLDIAEQIAVADLLCKGRLAPGFGSGSTDEEFRLFGLQPTAEQERHAQFERALSAIRQAWSSKTFLPAPLPDLPNRTWLAVNSTGAARIAGKLSFNMLFSHLRTIDQYHEYLYAYRAAGGSGLVAANRPIFVGGDDATALAEAEPALRILWRRFRDEGKIARDATEPEAPSELCGHPINFIVGSSENIAAQLRTLRERFPFDLLNVEVRWPGLTHEQVRQSLQRLMSNVMPLIR